MKTLLTQYPHATSFSLTGPFQTYFDQLHPYGTYKLDEVTINQIEKKTEKHLLQYLHDRYARWPSEDKNQHLPLDDLIVSIQQEVQAHLALVRSGQLPKDVSPFMCDVFMMGNAKYKQPMDLWHFYHEISHYEATYRATLDALKNNPVERDLLAIFQDPYYAPLQPCLIKTDISFFWHCTQSSQLAITYFFTINKQSLAWLHQLKGPFDMKALEDFALYCSNELLYSSCTHEGYETDLTAQK